MKKTSCIIILLSFILGNYSCSVGLYNNLNTDSTIGMVHFYTPNETSQLYLFSQGVDFGSPTVISNFNDSISIDTLLTAQLPLTSYDISEDIHVYEFIVKKVGVDNPVAKGNIIVDGQDISVETITGVFEIDTIFTEFDLPNAVIKVDE